MDFTIPRFLLKAILTLVLVLNFILFLTKNAKAASQPGLVAGYGFEEASGNYVYDASTFGNTGSLISGPTRNSNGKFGKAIKFDGINDRVKVPDRNSLDLTVGMTLMA